MPSPTKKLFYLAMPVILVSSCISTTTVSGSGTLLAEMQPFAIVVGSIVSDCNQKQKYI